MKILFLGTPEFAAEILKFLLEQRYNVVAVISQKDKPRGRGLQVLPTPVKEVALKYNIPVFQPSNLSKEGLEVIEAYKPDIGIVVAYGRLLKPPFLSALEFYNVHASLLPKYRGAAPIQRALENGERVTGVTIFRISEGMDDGDIALQKAFEVGECETFGEVYEKMLSVGKELLHEFLQRYPLPLRSQDHGAATYAPKIEKHDTFVRFDRPAKAVRDKIRAYDPVPGARAQINGAEVKLFGACELSATDRGEPGLVLRITSAGALVGTADGAVTIRYIQFPGRKRISFLDAKNGGLLKEGDAFSYDETLIEEQ